jgi:hypothetical protein
MNWLKSLAKTGARVSAEYLITLTGIRVIPLEELETRSLMASITSRAVISLRSEAWTLNVAVQF